MEKVEKLRGHKIKFDGKEYIYCDNNQPTIDGFFKRPCGECGKHRTKEGHDACLGKLPGVMNACCGHGSIENAYIQFLDGFSIDGKDAKKILNVLKKYSLEG